MASKLTKNFNYIEKENEGIWNSIVNYIEQAEKLDNSDLSSNYINIRKTLELIVKEYCSIANINFENENNITLDTQIKSIKNTGKVNSLIIKQMFDVKEKGNIGAHHTNEKYYGKITKIDVIHVLKELFYIIKELFEEKFKDIPNEFDEDSYNINLNTFDLNVISQQKRDEDNAFYSTRKSIKIDEDSIKSWLTLKNTKLLIPIYQRKYTWNKENVETLIDDIVARINDGEEHYFGAVAIKKDIDENGKNIVKIIDGQQRLTTSLLIVAACRQFARKNGRPLNNIKLYEEIDPNKKLSDYFWNASGTSKGNEAFRCIVDNVNAKNLDEDKNIRCISSTEFYKNYVVILNKLNELYKNNHYDVDVFIDTFLNRFKVASISFDVNHYTNRREMEVFENLNSKGKELTVPDFIKNHIFNYCSDELLDKKETQDRITSFYNNEVFDNCSEKDIEDFYKTLTEYVLGQETGKEKRTRIYESNRAINKFFDIKNNFNKIEEFEKTLNKLKIYKLLYNEVFKNSDECKLLRLFNCEYINEIIRDGKKTKLFSYFLFVIYEAICKKYNLDINGSNIDYQSIKEKLDKKDKESISLIFLEITKFLIRTKVIKGQGDSGIKRALIEIANKYFNIDKSIQQIQEGICKDLQEECDKSYSYEEFKINLYNNANHNKITELLLLTELIMCNALNGGEHINRKQHVSLEHIIPHNTNLWIDELEDSKKEEFLMKSNTYIEKIGNYLILSTKFNASAQHLTFDQKKQKVYNQLHSPLYKNDNKDIDISRKEKWTLDDVEKRTNALIDYVCKNVITK